MLEAFTLVYDNGHMSLEGACHSVQPLDVRVGGPHCQRSMSRAICHYVGIVSTHGIHASECGWLAWCDLVKSPPQH